MRIVVALVVAVLAPALATSQSGDAAVCEPRIQGVVTACDWVTAPGQYRLRSIVTRPAEAARPLPALLFVQWLSCDPVAINPTVSDGWTDLLLALVQRSGMIVARTEKAGIGGSGGPPCSELGYDEELAGHRAALAALRRSAHVHPESIFVFGGSMGGTMAPILGASEGVKGVIVAGTTAGSWLEHMLAIDRRVLELRGVSADSVHALMADHVRFEALYLGELKTPAQIASAWNGASAVWRRTLGTDTSLRRQYGRPVRFHHEAQRHNWPRAWAAVTAPVLVIHGEFDWIMPEEEHLRILRALSPARRTAATYIERARMGHDFLTYPSMEHSFRGEEGRFDPGVVDTILRWLGERRGQR